MKRWTALLTALLLLAALPALGEEEPMEAVTETDLSGYTVANGSVSYADYVDVTAPYSGTLSPFDLSAGDRVSAGDTIMTMLTTEVSAPEDGVITALFAAPGDAAADTLARYGCLGAMDGTLRYRIQASTAGAYNNTENRELHVGETLLIKTTVGSHKGSGTVLAVSGETYVMEVTEGDFETRDAVQLYRGTTAGRNKVGSGAVVARDPVLLTGGGRVEKVFVSEGAAVRKGDPIFSLMGPDADRGASSAVSSPKDGVIALVGVQPGQQVWKGALLARIYLDGSREVVAEVDEMDIDRLKVGDSIPVTLDMDEDRVLTGVVTSISGLGVTRQNAAYYQVHIRMEDPTLPLGASASVYIAR